MSQRTIDATASTSYTSPNMDVPTTVPTLSTVPTKRAAPAVATQPRGVVEPGAVGLRPDRVDPRAFRRVLGSFATGITVVTMQAGDETFGITVNAFMSVSLDPPLIAVSIDKRANAHATMVESGRFGVSVLRADQEDVSNHFAGRPCPRVEDVYADFAGFPVIDGALAHIVCRTHSVLPGGDHSIFLGEVEALRSDEGMPLLYFLGKYAHAREVELSE